MNRKNITFGYDGLMHYAQCNGTHAVGKTREEAERNLHLIRRSEKRLWWITAICTLAVIYLMLAAA